VGASLDIPDGALDAAVDGDETDGGLLALGVVVDADSPPMQPAASVATAAAARSRRVGR
jgi:hypothetical protein